MSFGSHHHHHHHHHHHQQPYHLPQRSLAEIREDKICTEEDYYTNIPRISAEKPQVSDIQTVYKIYEVKDRIQPNALQVSQTTYEESIDVEAGDYIRRKHLVMMNSA